MEMRAKTARAYIDERREDIIRISDQMWDLAELALHEHRSAKILVEALEAEGFQVEVGAGGMPTAFVATWGSGSPVIGFLGEYDALAGLSQKPVPYREEIVKGAPGHGCQHNLLGSAVYGAVIGLKKEMEARNLPGTIKYFGCPAEENLSGKAFMAREGTFDEVDACLTWHPSALNRVWSGSSLANNAANFTFHGRSAHAAADPHNGRSALDAVQLMNMGVEFLREHIPDKARVHYAITDGGQQPNVVPPVARVWYLARAQRRDQVDDLWERVLDCAARAAQMTGTTYEVELLKAIWNLLPSTTLEGVLESAMNRVGPPEFSPEDHEFAGRIRDTIPARVREDSLQAAGLPESEWEKSLSSMILSRPEKAGSMSGSTDVAEVSWCCPTAQFGVATAALGTPGHSWQSVAQAGMGIGHAGVMAAARVLAEAGLELLTDPEVLARAGQEFLERTGGRAYVCAMPSDHKPAFHQFAARE